MTNGRVVWAVLVANAVLYAMPGMSGDEETAVRRWAVEHGFSENGTYVVRIVAGKQGASRARAYLLEYAAQQRAYLPKAQHELPMEQIPLKIVVSRDGRYVAALGKKHAELDDLEDALWIWDSSRDVARHFAVTDFMSPDQIDRYVAAVPMFGGGLWFSDTGPTAPAFDAAGERLFVTPFFNSRSKRIPRSEESDWESERRVRYAVTLGRPTVIVDFTSMSVRTVERQELCAWRRRFDEAVAREEFTRELEGLYLSPRDAARLSVVHRTMRLPSLEFKVSRHVPPGGRPWLCRLDPGDGVRRARITVFRYSNADHSYRAVRVLNLANRVAPNEWLVTPNASHIVTLDEIDRIGVGQNVVVIYNVSTGESKKFRLEDFLSEEWLRKIESEPRGRMRLWRSAWWGTTILVRGPGVEARRRSGLRWLPSIVIDLDKMAVELDEVEAACPLKD